MIFICILLFNDLNFIIYILTIIYIKEHDMNIEFKRDKLRFLEKLRDERGIRIW